MLAVSGRSNRASTGGRSARETGGRCVLATSFDRARRA